MSDEEQLGLFNASESGPAKPRARPPVSEQAAHLERVSDRIAGHVFAFVKKIGVQRQFHMADLVRHVVSAMHPEPIAPDSPSRILRALRRRGVLGYKVLSRRESLYLVTSIATGFDRVEGGRVEES